MAVFFALIFCMLAFYAVAMSVAASGSAAATVVVFLLGACAVFLALLSMTE